jgi:DNA-binding transcriptional ArsR family regulator
MRSYDKPISPTQITRITGGSLGSVAYHVRTLTSAGVVVLADEGRVRGAVEHYYTLALSQDEPTLGDAAGLLLSLCGALTVPAKDGGYPQPVPVDDQARNDLTDLITTLRPRVQAIATAAAERAAASTSDRDQPDAA